VWSQRTLNLDYLELIKRACVPLKPTNPLQTTVFNEMILHMKPGDTPRIYNDILLHSYQGSPQKYLLKPSSEKNFLKYLENYGNVIGVIPLEEFNSKPEVLSPTLPSEVELYDGAEFVIVTASSNFEQRVSVASLFISPRRRCVMTILTFHL
jgi:hypothetical protein